MSIRTPGTAPSGEQGGPPTEPPYPWQLFVGMLLAILVGGAILAVSLGLNPLTFQKFASNPEATPVTSGATAVAANAAEARQTPLVTATAAPLVAPTHAPTSASTTAPQAVQTPVAVSTSAPVSVPAREGATAVAEVPVPATAVTSVSSAQVEPTPVQAAVPPELAAAIIQGFNNYWSVRVQASGDPSDPNLDLESVMADGELQAADETLAQYRQEGVAFRTTVHHQIWITAATPSEASVVDQYSGESVRLNLDSKQPDGSDPVSESYADVFDLKNMDGVWKVVSQQPWE